MPDDKDDPASNDNPVPAVGGDPITALAAEASKAEGKAAGPIGESRPKKELSLDGLDDATRDLIRRHRSQAVAEYRAKYEQESHDEPPGDSGRADSTNKGEPKKDSLASTAESLKAEITSLRREWEEERAQRAQQELNDMVVANLRAVIKEDNLPPAAAELLQRRLAEEAKKDNPDYDYLLLRTRAGVRQVLSAVGAYDMENQPVLPGGSQSAPAPASDKGNGEIRDPSGAKRREGFDARINAKMDALTDRLVGKGWRRYT